MKRLNILWIGLISVLMTACYDDYEKDYDESSVYFASQKPLRTLVADTDMSIKVGVAIGGKREVHTDDWATFEIDPSLLEGTGLTLMPRVLSLSRRRREFRLPIRWGQVIPLRLLSVLPF